MRGLTKHYGWWTVGGTLVVIGIIWGLTHCQPALEAAPEWNGIVPGYTASKELIASWGQPTAVLTRTGKSLAGQISWQIGATLSPRPVYTIYQYTDSNRGKQEIWLLNDRVVGIMVSGSEWSLPSQDESLSFLNLQTLVAQYGHPDKVLWADLPRHRCLVWAHAGLVGYTTATSEAANQYNLNMFSVLWFEPMTEKQFLRTKWPWPPSGGFSCAVTNQYTSGDAPDRLPRDPYDWHAILPADQK